MGLALTGQLHPVFAATAMAVSSLLVIAYSRNAGKLTAERESPELSTRPIEASA